MRRWSGGFVSLLMVLAECLPAPLQVVATEHQNATPSANASTRAQSSGNQSPVLHPGPGTAERKAILDGLRPAVERDLHQKVVFEVQNLNVLDGFAFLDGIPRTASGGKIDYSRTRYAAELEDGLLDGGDDAKIFAMLKLNGATWKLLTFVIGPTDVAYADWWRRFRAPKAIFLYNE